MSVQALTPAELKRRLDAGEALVVVDVREDEERALCAIAGSVHIPMSEFAQRSAELDPVQATVCVCHHGIRSAHVAAALEGQGFQRLFNLDGGIDRWATDLDPGMRRY